MVEVAGASMYITGKLDSPPSLSAWGIRGAETRAIPSFGLHFLLLGIPRPSAGCPPPGPVR